MSFPDVDLFTAVQSDHNEGDQAARNSKAGEEDDEGELVHDAPPVLMRDSRI